MCFRFTKAMIDGKSGKTARVVMTHEEINCIIDCLTAPAIVDQLAADLKKRLKVYVDTTIPKVEEETPQSSGYIPPV